MIVKGRGRHSQLTNKENEKGVNMNMPGAHSTEVC